MNTGEIILLDSYLSSLSITGAYQLVKSPIGSKSLFPEFGSPLTSPYIEYFLRRFFMLFSEKSYSTPVFPNKTDSSEANEVNAQQLPLPL